MIALVWLIVMASILGATVTTAWLRVRRLRAQAIVQTLALIVGQNIPLADALRAAGRYERRKLRRVFERIAHHLEVGDAVSTALKTAYPTCPGDLIGSIQGAERGGTLPSVLRSLAADLQRTRRSNSRLSPAVAYFFLIAVIAPSVALPVVIVLVPKYRAIFLDFGVQMPPLMEHLAAITQFVFDHGFLVTAGLLVLVIALGQLLLGRHLCPRVPDRFQWIAALTDTIAWHLPVLRRISETRSLARQLPIMQAAVRAGHDIVPAARFAACADANFNARRRLRRWAEQIEKGGEPAALARALGFPRALRRAISAARGPDELAAALDYLCSYYRSLLAHWEELLASAAIPVIVLLWGLAVGYVAFTIFVSLYAIVDATMADMY